jgi:hypothetical protein
MGWLEHRRGPTLRMSDDVWLSTPLKKKVREFPVPSRDVTTKLSLGGNNDVITELFLPGGVWLLTSRLETGNSWTFFYGVKTLELTIASQFRLLRHTLDSFHHTTDHINALRPSPLAKRGKLPIRTVPLAFVYCLFYTFPEIVALITMLLPSVAWRSL